MSKTKRELEMLKEGWRRDPCWDIEETDGFEEHRDELLGYRLEREVAWEREYAKNEKVLDAKAVELGLAGLYRMILLHGELLERHREAIKLLSDGRDRDAYRVLKFGII